MDKLPKPQNKKSVNLQSNVTVPYSGTLICSYSHSGGLCYVNGKIFAGFNKTAGEGAYGTDYAFIRVCSGDVVSGGTYYKDD